MPLKDVAKSMAHMMSLRMLMIVGIGLFVFAKSLFSDLGTVLTQSTATATVTDRVRECRIVIRGPGKKRVRKNLPCDEAYAAEKADTTKQTRVYRRTYVVLNFSGADGQIHTTRVREHKIGARRVPVGGQVTIAYNPANPRKVSRPTSSGKVFRSVLWISGLLIFLFIFFFGFQRLRAGLDRFKRQLDAAAKDAKFSRHKTKDELLARIEESFAAEAAPPAPQPTSPSAATPRPRPTPRPAKRPRRKPAPIPKTGSVVSKRRGWFGFAS